MSFNTRSGRGRGIQQTQVTYHQTPPRLQPNPTPFQNQYLQHQLPPFTPAPVAVAPAPAQPAPPGVVPQPLPVTMQTQDQQPQTQLSTPPQFKTMQITKMESGTPPASPTHSLGSASLIVEKEPTETRPWKKSKNPSLKVNKVLKRRRLNARFRKILFPKNAIMVLNELQPGVQFDGSESTNAFSQTSYSVKIDIDGVKYTGEGSTKASAKAAAAELAVKGIILKKIAESAKKDSSAVEEEPMETTSGDDMSEKSSVNGGRKVIPEDEVPWSSLASFALFKLFAEWKTQGSVIPPVVTLPSGKSAHKNSNPRNKPPGTAAAAAIAAGAAANATYVAIPAAAGGGVAASLVKPTTVPENADTLHPVTLVGRLFPGTVFTELSRLGTPPNLTFTMGATVTGIQYEGVGKNKKEAKKQCAMEVLKAAGVPYNPN